MAVNRSAQWMADETRWAELMASAQRGHEGDYRQLLEELSAAVHAYLLSRIGAAHFLEDCTQECLVAIHEARHTYQPQRPFRPWLFAIVRHKAVDSLRRQSRYERALVRETQVELGAAADDLLENARQGDLLRALRPQQRQAITLTKLLGLSTAEAAAALDISESALKVRVHRGIRHLRQLMEAEQ